MVASRIQIRVYIIMKREEIRLFKYAQPDFISSGDLSDTDEDRSF